MLNIARFFGVDVPTALTETTIKWFARSSIRYSIVHAIPNGHGAPCVDISIIFFPSWMGMRGFIYFHFPVKKSCEQLWWKRFLQEFWGFFIAEVRYGAYRRICSCKFNRFNVQIKIAFKCQAKGGIERFLFCIRMTLGGIALQGWIWQKCHERGARLSKIRAKKLISTCKICTCVHCFGDAKPSPQKIQWRDNFLGIFLLRLSSFALTFIGMLSRQSLPLLLFTIFLRCCRMSHQHRLYEFCIFLWVMQVHICVCCFYEYNVVLKTIVFMLFKTPNRWEFKNAQRTDM